MTVNIFQFINKFSDERCLISDELYLQEGDEIKLSELQLAHINVKALKKIYGDTVTIGVNVYGDIVFKAGVFTEGRSYQWVGEKHIVSNDNNQKYCNINLKNIDHGILDFYILAIKESIIFDGICKKAAITNINHQHILYDFVKPSYDLCCEIPLYFKFPVMFSPRETMRTGKAFYSFEDGFVHFAKDSAADLLTYFNSFSAVKWQKYTNVKKISAYVDFKGQGTISLVHKAEDCEMIIASWSLDAPERATFDLPIGEYPQDGILGLQIFAEMESILYGGGWCTSDSETQNVRLGIGITTFKREEAVKKAVARLGEAIAAHPLYKNSIDITVVDNGQTLEAKDLSYAHLIPNRNLGGTGGFMRNLIYYQENGNYTHCLFMDDDASCEAGSIFRSMSFLRHANVEDIAISGAMLSDTVKFKQWENGAYFDGGCHPLHSGYELFNTDAVLMNENEKDYLDKKIYGAWWFFMHPIQTEINYSFPFFVRGDDVFYSYSNNFKILTLNGVCVWQEDFILKNTPFVIYLDIRQNIIQHLIHNGLDDNKLFKFIKRIFNDYNQTYHYGTAKAIIKAIKDIFEKNIFWKKI